MDIEQDDFANDKELQRQRKEKKEYAKMFDKCIRIISNEFLLEPYSHKNMKGFLMFKALGYPIPTHSFKSTDGNNLRVSIVDYFTSFRTARQINAGTDPYFFGMISLIKNYPSTYIYRETLREKISDIFLKQDVDFEDQEKFSRKFHVVTHDREKLILLFNKKPLNDFTTFPEMEIEIRGQACLFRESRKPLSLDTTANFISLAKKIMQILN